MVLSTEIQKLPDLTAYVMLPEECPVTKIKIIPEDMPQRAEFFVPNKEVGLVISHAKFAEKLEQDYEKAFSMDDVIDGELVIDDKSDAKDDAGAESKDNSESKDVEEVPDNAVFANSFDIVDDSVILHLDTGKQITVVKKKITEEKFDKNNMGLAKGGSVLMISGHMYPINEIVLNHEIDYAKIVSVGFDRDYLCVGLSNNKMLEVKLDAVGVKEKAGQEFQILDTKKTVMLGEKQVELTDIVKKGKFV